MAYGKRKFPTSSRFVQRKALKSSMNVQKLDAKLNRYRRQDTEWTQYQVKTAGSPAIGQVYIWHMTKLSTWIERFGPSPAGVPYLHKIDYDLYFKEGDEAGPTTFTAFLVSLKSDTQTQLCENQGTDLSAGLVENTHYISGQQATDTGLDIGSGQVYLNPAYFRVHKKMQFALGKDMFWTGSGSAPQSKNMSDTGRRFTGTIKCNKKLQNGRGNFAPSVMSTCDNSAKVFLLVFSDNASGVEGSPILNGQCMVTVRST